MPVEESAGGVDVHHLLVYEGSVALLRILLGCIPEETAADGFLNSDRGFPTRHHIQLMPAEEKLSIIGTQKAAAFL